MKRLSLVIITLLSTLLMSSFNKTTNVSFRKSIASYYHSKFNGRKTANGEVFSNKKMTAAHKKLKFGTKVKVTNLRNGKSVIVRINDRGPYHSQREIDLSKAAFKKIGNLKRGTIPIKYKIIK